MRTDFERPGLGPGAAQETETVASAARIETHPPRTFTPSPPIRVYALTGRLLSRPDLAAKMLAEGDGLPKLRRATSSLLGVRFAALTRTFKYLGGSYVARDHHGTPDARPAFRPVLGMEQRRALTFVLEHAFEDDVFPIAPDVLDRLGPDRWAHWGATGFQARQDFALHDWVNTYHSAPLNALFSAAQLSRMQEAEHKWDDVVTMVELFDAVSAHVWRELDADGASISSFRRNAQRRHLDMLVAHTLSQIDGAPNDARALARLHLARLERRIGARLDGTPGDDYTTAHLELARARARQALEASLVKEL